MKLRYYGKIKKNKLAKLKNYSRSCAVFGLSGGLVGYIFPLYLDEELHLCHISSVIVFAVFGIFVGLIDTKWNVPLYKFNMVILSAIAFSYYIVKLMYCSVF